MRVMTENPMGRQRSGWRYKLYRAGRGIQRNWGLYLLLLPAVVLLFCFNYLPMYGVQIAFRDFSPSQGIQGSPWVGPANFQKFFNSFQSKNLIWNTVSLSLYSLIAGFPFPIILALMVNQIRVKRFKQVLQAKPYSYLPATSDRGERVSNGLPGQTVKGRDCNTEEGGCFGNAEAPDDDHCNPAHVWNFSFPVYP